MLEHIPPEVRTAGPGIAGSLLALMFLRRPKLMLVGMFLGGCLLSYIGTSWLAEYLEVGAKGEGLVGFLIGLFGMTTVAKVYDLFESIQTPEVWATLREWVRKRLGLEPRPEDKR